MSMNQQIYAAGLPAPSYGWIITDDHTEEGEGDAGTMGPRGLGAEIEKRLKAGEGRKFRMYDGDGEHYYTGRIITAPGEEGGEVDFAPLDDFGKPNVGATEIHYRDESGTWQEL